MLFLFSPGHLFVSTISLGYPHHSFHWCLFFQEPPGSFT